MPHCIIDYSQSLAPYADTLLSCVHQGALNSALFTEHDIKTRAIAYPYSQVGTANTPFVHVTVKLLSGRDTDQKKQLSQAILHSLQVCSLGACSLTVEVVDIDSASYAKAVS